MIIGLIGAPGAGKNIIADFFVTKKNFKKFAFADLIKEEYYKESGYNEDQFKGSRGTNLEHIIRKGLWEYSSKAKKEKGPLCFVTPVIEKIILCKKNNEDVVITDVRTEEEINELLCFDTEFIVVCRDNKDLDYNDIPGTKVSNKFVLEIAKFVFFNDYDTIEKAHESMQNHYEMYFGEGY